MQEQGLNGEGMLWSRPDQESSLIGIAEVFLDAPVDLNGRENSLQVFN